MCKLSGRRNYQAARNYQVAQLSSGMNFPFFEIPPLKFPLFETPPFFNVVFGCALDNLACLIITPPTVLHPVSACAIITSEAGAREWGGTVVRLGKPEHLGHLSYNPLDLALDSLFLEDFWLGDQRTTSDLLSQIRQHFGSTTSSR